MTLDIQPPHLDIILATRPCCTCDSGRLVYVEVCPPLYLPYPIPVFTSPLQLQRLSLLSDLGIVWLSLTTLYQQQSLSI